jgi:tetratricopeptide (TPR) repeat protein
MAMRALKLILAVSMASPLLAQTASDSIAAHAQAAQEAERRNDFPTAIREYDYLVHQLPRSIEMQSNLGVALYFDHQWTRSIEVLRKASALNPALLAPHLFSGLAWYQLAKPDAAAPELEKAVHLRSSDVIAHTWLGYTYVAQSRYKAASKQFEAVCRLAPDNIDAWYALGQSYLQIGKDATRELLAIAPDGGRAWELAGEQSQLQGDNKKALVDFQEANKRRPDIPELRKQIADMGGTEIAGPISQTGRNSQEEALYREAHDAEQDARTAFEHVIQIDPNSYRAHQIMADALIAEQQNEKGIEEYRTVLQLKPDLPGIHEAVGNILVEAGKLPDALKEFQDEVQLQPRSATAHMNVGRVLLMMGDDESAGRSLADALKLDRPPLETYFLLGKLELRRNRYPAAIAALTHYLSTEKEASSAYYLLARAYRGTGDKEQMSRALQLYKKTSQDIEKRGLAQKDLARLADKNQIAEEAADPKAAALTGDNP